MTLLLILVRSGSAVFRSTLDILPSLFPGIAESISLIQFLLVKEIMLFTKELCMK